MKRKESTRNAHKNRPAKGNRASGPVAALPASQPQWDRLARHMQALQLAERDQPSPTPATSGPPLLAAAPGTLQQVGREADMAWAGVKRIWSLLNVENKHVYYNAVGTIITSAGSVLDLCSLISQGVGGAQRVGDSLKLLRARVKTIVTRNASATQPQAFTMVLGHSKDGVPAVADVFAIVGGTASGLAYPSDTYQQAEKWSEAKTSYVSSTDISKYLEFDVKFNHDVLFTDGTATTASGNVWFAFISNEPTNYPTMSIAIDVEFVDN